MSELEYVDPYEGKGPISNTPPPACDKTKEHEVCVPPAWGEEIPGSVVTCRCLLCHQEDQHHAVWCVQCQNAPGCCVCIWGYMRSQYNSGCPLCRAGDPQGEDPLAPNQRRITPIRRELVVYNSRKRGRGRRGRGRRGIPGAVATCGIGRARGRGRPQGQSAPQEQSAPEEQSAPQQNTARRASRRFAIRRPGRGRSTTIEKEEEEEGER